MDFNKNNLIDETLARYYTTFACTLDTADFVPLEYNKKIHAYIFKNMKAAFKRVNREDRAYRRKLRKESLMAAKAKKVARKRELQALSKQRKKERLAKKRRRQSAA